jgi:hypothetical protein
VTKMVSTKIFETPKKEEKKSECNKIPSVGK